MKYKLVLLAIMVTVLVCDASPELKKRKIKKIRKTTLAPTIEALTEPSPISFVQDTSKEAPAVTVKEPNHEKSEFAQHVIYGYGNVNENEVSVDPCNQIQCSAGRVCELSKDGEPECVCIEECPYEKEERRRVCTNTNETFGSDCEVHRERCMCMTGRSECKGAQYNHVQVEYYGVCREMPECSPSEMSDFPRRMRDWLFFIMRDMADRHELSEHYMSLEKEAHNNLTRGWVNAAIWKWCDLDADDNDRFVSRHELFPIRAPLMSLEHCISPFLDGCDSNNDHRITLMEWGRCLALDENELTDRCEDIGEVE